MQIFHADGSKGGGFDDLGGVLFYKNGDKACGWDNGKGGQAWYKDGKKACGWDDGKGGRAWYKNGVQAWGWEYGKGSGSYYNDGSYKGTDNKIFLGDGILLQLSSIGINIFFNGYPSSTIKVGYDVGSLIISKDFQIQADENNGISDNQDPEVVSPDTSVCEWCKNVFKSGNGYSAWLRINGRHKKYLYCSKTCFSHHFHSGDYVMVNEYGHTEEEAHRPASRESMQEAIKAYEEYAAYVEAEKEKKRKKAEAVEAEERKKAEDEQSDKVFFKKYGAWLVLGICIVAGYALLSSPTDENTIPGLLVLFGFFGFYVAYSLFPDMFDSKEQKEINAKYKLETVRTSRTGKIIKIGIGLILFAAAVIYALLNK